MIRKIIIFSIFVLLTAGSALYAQDSNKKLEDMGFQVFKEKVSSIDFTLTSITGEKKSLSDYRGKTVLLNFWATWCPPCRSEMPSMEDLYKKMDKNSFEILAVNIQEDKKTVEDFINRNRYTFPVLLDEKGEAASIYQIRSIPTTFLLDKNGFIFAALTGSREWNETEVVRILKEMAGK